MVITRDKKRSPDMILTAFDEKFHETKDAIPPRAWTFKKAEKNNVEKVGPTKLKKTMSERWVYIFLYTFKYLQIALYTSK